MSNAVSFYVTSLFEREVKKLEPEVRKLLGKKLELFSDRKNHKALKVHKLHGALKDKYGFWVTHSVRVMFSWADKQSVTLLRVGNHDIYDRQSFPIRHAPFGYLRGRCPEL